MYGIVGVRRSSELPDVKRLTELRAWRRKGAGGFTSIVYHTFTLDQWISKWMTG